MGNPNWTACVEGVRSLQGPRQPAEVNAPRQRAAAPNPAGRPSVNGLVIPTCSHGGLCHGQLLEALLGGEP